MADTKISALAAGTTPDGTEKIPGVQGGATVSFTAKQLGAASGTSFPGSPSSGDRFYRTDRNIEYFYDGTRWLSTQLFTAGYPYNVAATTNPLDASAPHPFRHKGYSIYIEDWQAASVLTNGTTASNYYAFRLSTFESTGSVVTSLGSGLSSQNDTQNVWTSRSEAIGAVVASTVEMIYVSLTETGAATAFYSFSYTYRLVG